LTIAIIGMAMARTQKEEAAARTAPRRTTIRESGMISLPSLPLQQPTDIDGAALQIANGDGLACA
jgi:hypothetical protein